MNKIPLSTCAVLFSLLVVQTSADCLSSILSKSNENFDSGFQKALQEVAASVKTNIEDIIAAEQKCMLADVNPIIDAKLPDYHLAVEQAYSFLEDIIESEPQCTTVEVIGPAFSQAMPEFIAVNNAFTISSVFEVGFSSFYVSVLARDIMEAVTAAWSRACAGTCEERIAIAQVLANELAEVVVEVYQCNS